MQEFINLCFHTTTVNYVKNFLTNFQHRHDTRIYVIHAKICKMLIYKLVAVSTHSLQATDSMRSSWDK
jgi:hypothetical protein